MKDILKNVFSTRYKQLLGVFLLLAVILVVRLFILTVFEHKTWAQNAKSISTKTVYTTAPRGNIYDRNGKLLAGSKQSFTVKISGEDQTDAQLNKTIHNLLTVLTRNHDKIEDDFPIKLSNGHYTYTYDGEITKWLRKNNLSTDLTAREAFRALRQKLGIDSSLSDYDAQLQMQQTYSTYPPINVNTMQYTADEEKNTFLEQYFPNMSDKERMKLSAKEAFARIREDMGIKKTYSNQYARKIMTVRYSIDALGYNKYLSAVVSKDVSEDTVMLIEEGSDDLKGVQVVSESTRYYPSASTAAHVLGYLGEISDDKKEEYEKKGYSSDELIGQYGIEQKYESSLKGKDGTKTVQVNASGETEKVLSETSPQKGKDVYLTLDLSLQKAAESGLSKTINAMRYGGTVTSKYGSSSPSESAPNAKSGAIVAIDVKSGDVLALANYPSFNPNLFAEGISSANWNKLQSSNPRDPLAASPLYNMATMSTVQPGSTFKPVTATAALECGLNPNAYLTDAGYIKLGGQTFACVMWNLYKKNHGSLNMYRAIGVSCNYYFYDIATNKDWANGGTLGYKKKISWKTITNYAKQYGLGKPTGIELDEATGLVPSEKHKINAEKTQLKYQLQAAAEEYFKSDVVKNSEQLNRNIDGIVSLLTKKNLSWDELVDKTLPGYGIKKSKCDKVGQLVLYTYYPESKWTTADTFNICIGQGDNSYTPLQMCNYIATLGNKGLHHQVSIVKSVQGKGSTKKKKTSRVKVSSKRYFSEVLQGMYYVGNNQESTVSKYFKNLDVKVAAKTGTAERQGKVNPKSEVSYIRQHLSQINSSLSWSRVKKEMNRLMKTYPDTYQSEDTAVRRAVINLSHGKVDTDDLDRYKSDYDNFAWVVALAPYDDPQIAVCVMVPQGATAANAAPAVKEVIGAYFDKSKKYSSYSNTTGITGTSGSGAGSSTGSDNTGSAATTNTADTQQ